VVIVFRKLTRLNWIAVVLSPVAVILLEAFWVYPWLVWAGEWPKPNIERPPLSLISLIFLLSTSFFITRFFLSRKRSLKWIQLSIVLVAIFLVLRLEYSAGFNLLSRQWFIHAIQIIIDSFSHPHAITLALIVSIYLSWRGIRLGYSSLYFRDVYRNFLIGLSALIILIIFWTITLGIGSLKNLASTFGLYVTGFFFFGLMGLALGNLQAIRRRTLLEEKAPLSNGRWITIIFGVIGSTVLLGIGVASIFSSNFVELLGRLWNFTINLLIQAIHYLLIPLGYLAEWLVYIVQFIINLISAREQQLFPMPEFFEPELPKAVTTPSSTLDIVLVLKWILFTLVVFAAIFLLFKAISRFRSFQADAELEVEEVNESLWSWQDFKADLRLFFSMIFQRWQRKRTEPVQVTPAPTWYISNDIQDILDMREIYRRLLWEASAFGITRQQHETPYEYTKRLTKAVPESTPQLEELTKLYISVRYGDLKVEDEKAEYANSLWRVLRRLLRIPERYT